MNADAARIHRAASEQKVYVEFCSLSQAISPCVSTRYERLSLGFAEGSKDARITLTIVYVDSSLAQCHVVALQKYALPAPSCPIPDVRPSHVDLAHAVALGLVM